MQIANQYRFWKVYLIVVNKHFSLLRLSFAYRKIELTNKVCWLTNYHVLAFLRKILTLFLMLFKAANSKRVDEFISQLNKQRSQVIGRRCFDRHGLGSKPTCAILLYPWERYFTALSPACWSWQSFCSVISVLISSGQQYLVFFLKQIGVIAYPMY